MALIQDVTFTVTCVGSTTGEEFKGIFKCRPILTHAQQLGRDQFRRDLLGVDPDSASPRALNQATLLSEIAARLTDAPSWWKDSRDGRELYDDEPVAAIYSEVIQAENNFRDAIIAKAEKARLDLAKMPNKE